MSVKIDGTKSSIRRCNKGQCSHTGNYGESKRHYSWWIRAKSQWGGVSSIDKFYSVFGLKSGHILFAAIEKLSRTLQAENTTLQEPTAAVTFAKAYYTRLRILSEFNRSFDACITFAEGKITNPVLPRHRRILARLDDGTPLIASF